MPINMHEAVQFQGHRLLHDAVLFKSSIFSYVTASLWLLRPVCSPLYLPWKHIKSNTLCSLSSRGTLMVHLKYIFNFSDRCETEEGKQRVDYAQASLVAALGLQLSRSHQKDPQALARCLVMLADLRYFSDQICKSQCKLAKLFGVAKDNVPPLTKEIMCPLSKMVNSKLSTMLQKM